MVYECKICGSENVRTKYLRPSGGSSAFYSTWCRDCNKPACLLRLSAEEDDERFIIILDEWGDNVRN